MLEVKAERCAGIDVGKKFLAVCVMTIAPALKLGLFLFKLEHYQQVGSGLLSPLPASLVR